MAYGFKQNSLDLEFDVVCREIFLVWVGYLPMIVSQALFNPLTVEKCSKNMFVFAFKILKFFQTIFVNTLQPTLEKLRFSKK